jgi:hypothetical protein
LLQFRKQSLVSGIGRVFRLGAVEGIGHAWLSTDFTRGVS